MVDGRMSVSELNEILDLRIPDDDWDTIGGFVFNTLGHVPERGDSIDYDGWQFIADEVEGRRLRRLRVIVTAFDDEDDSSAEERGASGK
jgi:CBS domain containing-hemolysin-like protein